MTYVVALIPARSGSRGLPGKNIRKLVGIPLLVYSVRAAQKAGNIDRVIVSTDSEEYAEIAKKASAEVPFIQPVETARDDSGDYPFLAHALAWMDRSEKRLPDLIVHLRPTTPLRDPALVADAVQRMALRDDEDWRHGEPTALRSVHEMSESAHKCFQVINGSLVTLEGSFDVESANRPRQDYITTYQANGYVDVLRTDYIRRHGKIHGDRVTAFATPPVIEVDTEENFKLLQLQAAANPQLVSRVLV